MDDLNRQGDYISGAIGPDGKDILVGKGLTQNEQNVTVNLPPPPPPGHFPPNHPVREYTLADVVVALIGNPMTGEPGLVSQLTAVVIQLGVMNKAQDEAHKERMTLIDDVKLLKSNRYTQVFQILVLVIAAVILVSFVLLLLRSR